MSAKQIVVLVVIALLALIAAVLVHPSSNNYLGLNLSNDANTSIASSSANTVINNGTPAGNPTPTAPIHAAATKEAHNTPVTPVASSSFTASTSAPRTLLRPQVHVTILEPDGKQSFDVDLINGDDLCDDLMEAKREGDLHSLTIDNSYESSFGSRYIREINGYSNNWTVEVNGTSPEGCSLYKPHAGDSIVWTFGS